VRRIIATRLVHGVIVVLIVATITFVLIHAAPGDPFSGFADPLISDVQRLRLIRQFGLDRPLPEQYFRYLLNLARGDFGYSITHAAPVATVMLRALGNTLVLMGSAIVITFVLGIAIALMQVRRAGRATDRALSLTSMVLYSTPEFWLAITLMIVFAYWIPIFPVSGMTTPVVYDYLGPLGRLGDRLWHLALPALTIVLVATGGVARYQKAELLEVLPLDYVRTARAKGVSEWRVLTVHALRNALVPTVTLFGLSFPTMFGGAVLVERIFSWHGMGWVVTEAIGSRDYALVTSAVVVGAVTVVLGNLLGDLILARVAPHARREI
jgi:peptide/nickel transport system permease protein